MKKFIVLFILSFIFLSCENRYITRNVYGRTYYEIDYAITDIYYQLEVYDIEILPINEWLTLYAENDTIIIVQKMMHKFVNNDSRYQFIFTSFIYPSYSKFRFTIRYSGLKKDFK